MSKLIAKTLAAFFVVAYLIISYVMWDFGWFRDMGEWSKGARAVAAYFIAAATAIAVSFVWIMEKHNDR
jgi:uncharacterized membrane protein YdcZ (DUF606 family)